MVRSKNETRQKQLEHLYVRNHQFILDLALSERRILAPDGHRIAAIVAQRLTAYRGRLTDESLQRWASKIIKKEAQRLSDFYSIISENGWAIRAGIRATLGFGTEAPNKFDDNAALVEEAFQDVSLWIYNNLDKFKKRVSKSGQKRVPKFSTRLFALAKRHTLDYYVKKVQTRRKAVARHLASGGRFFLSERDIEIATERLETAS